MVPCERLRAASSTKWALRGEGPCLRMSGACLVLGTRSRLPCRERTAWLGCYHCSTGYLALELRERRQLRRPNSATDLWLVPPQQTAEIEWLRTGARRLYLRTIRTCVTGQKKKKKREERIENKDETPQFGGCTAQNYVRKWPKIRGKHTIYETEASNFKIFLGNTPPEPISLCAYPFLCNPVGGGACWSCVAVWWL